MFGVVRFRPGRLWPLPALLVCLLLLPTASYAERPASTAAYVPSPEEEAHTVYLTFDDGPSANTTALLEVLDEFGIRATFFVTGQYEGDTAGLLRHIAERGHSIGLHSFAHEYNEIYSYSEAFFADLEKVDELVFSATGLRATLYRFPGGSLNSHCPEWLRAELRRQLADRGYTYFDWNVVSGDQGHTVYTAQELFDNVINGAAQVTSGPLFILFHDTNHCSTTPEAVRLVAEHFLEEGWQFRPITGDTAPIHF
ncbi:MAG: polysaccharide deacetylase [Oscillospiraceae bacterium]|nr:polysaccharide deacetylase [Oscillospiraceae bacterium]